MTCTCVHGIGGIRMLILAFFSMSVGCNGIGVARVTFGMIGSDGVYRFLLP